MKMYRRSIHKFSSYLLVLILSCTLFTNALERSAYAEPEENTATATSPEDLSAAPAAWPAGPDIFAETGVLIEASTGTVLYDKSCHQQMYPASITKIMTTLLSLENGNLSDPVEFYHYDVYSLEYGDASIARQEGEILTLEQTLYAVMLASANECANAAGEFVARKTDTFKNRIAELQTSGEDYDEDKVAIGVFADMMNERARQAGALGTHFSNPNGLFMEDHYTTAYDMAMIMRAALKNEEFLKIESKTSYTIPATNKNPETHTVYQRHKMAFTSNQYYYEGFLGGKTGYVDQSGTTLVTSAKRNGMTLISVVMRSNGEHVYNDTKLLLDYGFNNFSLSNIAENETRFTLSGLGSLTNLSSVFDTNSTLIEISKEGNVVLPNGAVFADCTSELSFDDTASGNSDSSNKTSDQNEAVNTSTGNSDLSDTTSGNTNSSDTNLSGSGNDNTASDSTGSDKTNAGITDSGNTAPSKEKIATIHYFYNGIEVGATDLLLNKSDTTFAFGPTKEVETVQPIKKKKYVNINIWLLLSCIIGAVVILAIIYYSRMFQHWNRIKRRKRRKRSRNSYYGSPYKRKRRR